MKKWTALALPFLLILWFAAPAAGSDHRPGADGPTLGLDIERVANWLITLWFDYGAEAEISTPEGEVPEAFIQGVGPYIVPVGSDAPDANAVDELANDAATSSENP
ncbi:MAG: hypothetical protein AAFY88_05220 [Acidobacteriota bacterium]